MREVEKTILFNYKFKLFRDGGAKELANWMFAKNLITESDLELVYSKPTNEEGMLILVRIVARKCESLEDFVDALEGTKHSIAKEIKLEMVQLIHREAKTTPNRLEECAASGEFAGSSKISQFKNENLELIHRETLDELLNALNHREVDMLERRQPAESRTVPTDNDSSAAGAGAGEIQKILPAQQGAILPAQQKRAMGKLEEIRVVVTGDSRAGKSGLTIQFIQNHFVEDYDPTIEDSYRKSSIIDGQNVFFDILDTAGQEEYSHMRDLYARNADVFIHCVSVEHKDSLLDSPSEFEYFRRVKGSGDVPILLAVTRCELRAEGKGQFSLKEAEDYAKEWGVHAIMECSAKTRQNVDEIFSEAGRAVLQRRLSSAQEFREKKLAKPFRWFKKRAT